MRNFQMTWITGTTNQKISVIMEHTSSEIHKVALGHLKSVSAMDELRVRYKEFNHP